MTREELLAQAAVIAAFLRDLDATEPAVAEKALRGFRVSGFEEALRAAHAEGWATPKEAGGVRFGRIARADAALSGFSLDVVEMSAAAPGARPLSLPAIAHKFRDFFYFASHDITKTLKSWDSIKDPRFCTQCHMI